MARLIAIDLGAHAVKLTVLNGSARSHVLDDQIVRPVPQDGMALPTLADRLASLDLILRENPDLSTGSLASVSWPGDQVATHRLSMPFTDPAQVEQTLPFAIEAEVPFELDEMLLGWRQKVVGDASEVMTSLVHRDAVKDLLEGLQARGLDPRQLLADGDLLSAYAPYDDSVAVIIDVGHAHTVVSIARRGVTESYRSISVAGRTFTRAIQAALECTWGVAERVKHGEVDEEALPEGDDDRTDPGPGMPPAARTALNGAIGLLLAEIRSTLIQAEDDLGVEIEEVILTGGGSRIPELAGWLAQDLGLPVGAVEDADGMSVRPEMALSHALAWHMAGEREAEVTDLRVGELAFRGGLDLTRAILTYGGAGMGFFVAAVVVMFSYQFQTLSAEQAEVEARIFAEVGAAVPGLAGLEMDTTAAVGAIRGAVEDASREAEFLGDGSETPETVDLLHTLTKAFPDHPTVIVDLSTLDILPTAINMQGETEGFSNLDAIAEALEASPAFGEVAKTPGQKTASGKLKFTIDIARLGAGGAEGEEG